MFVDWVTAQLPVTGPSQEHAMPKYLLTYKGDATDTGDMTPEQGEAVLQAWGAWIGRVGEAMVDVGQPIGPTRASVVDDGSEGTPVPLSGYSIIEAADLDGAKAHVEAHPFLSEDTGDFAVDVYELAPLPEM